MINNCYELMSYIHKHCKNNIFDLYKNTGKSFGISDDELKLYVDQLVSYGYAQRFIRSIVLTNAALDYLE